MPKHSAASGSARYLERLTYISRVYALVGPFGILATLAAAHYAFTDFFDETSRNYILIELVIVFTIVIARVLFRNITRKRLAIEYILVTLIGTASFSFLVPFPSAYILAGAVFGILIYFDFGVALAALSLAVQYGTMVAVQVNTDPTLSTFITALGFALGPITMAAFIIRLQSLSRQEIKSIEQNNTKAQDNQQQIQSLINNIADGVVAVDHTLRVMMYNAAALDVLDINVDIHGKHISKFLQPINAENQSIDITDLLHETKTQTTSRDMKIKYNDGSVANLFLSIAPIYLGYGKKANNGFTILLRDITREKSLEEERNEFISVVSHELRTPIAITEGNISNAEFVAEKTGDITAIKDALKSSHTQVIFLADMINDLSTLSRAERGVLQLDIEDINVEDLVTDLTKNYTPQAEAKGLAFTTKLDPSAKILQSSKLYTREILQNFITNAIKYTDTGTVTVETIATEKGIKFAVHDTGIGISKGDQQKVFDKFFRSEDFRTRKANGTGLGLYVTMKLTRLVHAEIDVTSELNKGSTFTIFIPNLA